MNVSKYFFHALACCCMIVSAVMCASCLSDNEETIALKENLKVKALTSFVNTQGQTTLVYNTGKGSDAYIFTNKSGGVDKINLVFSKLGTTDNGTVFLFNNAIRSITIKNVTYTFSKNKNNKVDVAVTANGITELYTDVASASLISYDDASNLSKIFICIVNGIGVIRTTNSNVSRDSELYQYIIGIESLLSEMETSAKKFTDSNTTRDLVENAKDGIDPGIDTSGVSSNERDAENNTDLGNGAIVSGIGELKVTLTWKFDSDIDLHVYEPGFGGSVPSTSSLKGHIFYKYPKNSYTDGYLDIDNTIGYYKNPLNGETNTNISAVENVYWNENPSDGTFYIYLNNYNGKTAGPCNVTVYKRGKTVFSKTVGITTDKTTQLFVCSVKMPQGTVSTSRAAGNKIFTFDYWNLPNK